ncbi:hypothetical protein Tsubulata_003116 [Turnera subulata]|uniref:Calponin-homology (CH) domain-containing protein n=1 Tax=Turnera subulata TaxID=218843 RepID=A0A9Q0FVJ2_9ROSI|nr:hypothetical protein Tsubulata_003116 [Turnera subulata]
MEGNEQKQKPCPSSSSSVFKDLSNFQTPKRQLPHHHHHHHHHRNLTSPSLKFFTASKQATTTPLSSSSAFRSRTTRKLSSSAAATARKLKAFELDQSLSSRKAQLHKQKSLKSLANSLSTWLNFLFQNPTACHLTTLPEKCPDSTTPVRLGKRDAPGDDPWRSPKRTRDLTWRHGEEDGDGDGNGWFSSSRHYAKLSNSLNDVCSFDDLKQRMKVYLSLGSCKEVFDVMTRVVKSIDEGRLKMKPHCPIVTDVGMREKAIQILMSYNPTWLRIGLHIILGGDSLLPVEGDVNSSDQDIAFLKMVIEKQFFSHAGLAKAFAYNRMVEGLYRPGYYESLGNIILKRFLLLALVLDRAKSSSSLPLKYGIDGTDGGSPLLFVTQSSIKSSSQMVNDFLPSEVMHGEGNLLAHLVIVGYKLSYEQCALVDYDFRVVDIFTDLQDGIRLCRAIQLLQNDSSILTKMALPSDTRKKNLTNCALALQYLKTAGMALNDEDGMTILAEDIADGDKELTVSLLWNIFVHLQLPLLLNKTILAEEILKVRGGIEDQQKSSSSGALPLELLLNWIQAVCDKYDYNIDNFSSLVDGKAIWCLLDYYFRKELLCPHSLKVLQTSEILEHNGAINEKSVVVLLVLLASQLTMKKKMDQLNFHKLLCRNCRIPEARHSSLVKCSDHSKQEFDKEEIDGLNAEDAARKFMAIKAWWQDMAERNNKFVTKPAISALQCKSTSKSSINIQRENAAILIQSYFRRSIEHGHFWKMKSAISFLRNILRAWLLVKHSSLAYESCGITVRGLPHDMWKQPETVRRFVKFIADRHGFVKLRKSVLLIQKAARIWMACRRQNESIRSREINSAAIVVQKFYRGWAARSKCKVSQMDNAKTKHQHAAATKIQSHFRGWLLRKQFVNLERAITTIQCAFRCLRCCRNFRKYRITSRSAIIIQSHVRGWIARKEVGRQRYLIVVLQGCCRGWLRRREFLLQQEAATEIQRAIRCINCWKAFHSYKHAAIEIQRFVRGQITRKKLLGASETSNTFSQGWELKVMLSSVLKLQRWWRGIVLRKLRAKAAIVIQSYVRGWIGRQKASRERQRVVVLQSYWKGYLARKELRGRLLDLRLRIEKSAKNVDDSMRLINRLIVALSELSTMKSVSGILHTCATLDMATEHSQKCCEKLVAAGAVEHLLKLIRSVSRSIPDQEVLKHALSALRNLARYPHLIEVLIDSHESVQTLLWEVVRNKEEGYFLALDVLKKMCSNKKGVEAVKKSPALLKRLHSLVEELTRKGNLAKKNPKGVAGRENIDRRLREAAQLLKLITSSR